MSRITHRLPIGHELLAAVAIGALSALLAAGLGVLGLLGALNGTISRWVGHATPRSLPVWLPWLAAVVFAFALALVAVVVVDRCKRQVAAALEQPASSLPPVSSGPRRPGFDHSAAKTNPVPPTRSTVVIISVILVCSLQRRGRVCRRRTSMITGKPSPPTMTTTISRQADPPRSA